MAGYVFAIGGDADPVAAIRECAEKGVFSTYLNSLSPLPFEGTLADYMSMKPGDNIYFFCKRKYYGVGELIDVGPDCKYCNFPDSERLSRVAYQDIQNSLLVDYGEQSPHFRWLCTFKGSPYLFMEGIDTDEILTYKPDTFKMLRAFWKVSFIKLGDEENNSLKEIFLLRRQQEALTHQGVFQTADETHARMLSKPLEEYVIKPTALLQSCNTGTRLRHEMALEANVVYDLVHGNIQILGNWDYVSHQVIASPFKPIDYMDKIDVFAMRYLPDSRIPAKYLVAELKKDAADNDTIDQVLKYVDWVCGEYAYSDYEMIDACIIAAEFTQGINEYYRNVVRRFYTLGSHPVRNKQWTALKLITYAYSDGAIHYTDVTPGVGEDE